MPRAFANTAIYHITDVTNLPAILKAGGLLSDVALVEAGGPQTQIGYAHMKRRRMTEYVVDCCGNRFVGSFVPFYFCPRSVMLYTVNQGNSGREKGCQSTIVHLVSSAEHGASLGRPWAISDGNAGAEHASFSSSRAAIDELDWSAIEANSWGGRTHQKAAEFLVADFFPWSSILKIGCQNQKTQSVVEQIIASHAHRPTVTTNQNWYY